MSAETINLTLAEIGDDTQFDELFNDWQVKTIIAQHTITEASLRTISRLWFQRGIARGTDWAGEEICADISAVLLARQELKQAILQTIEAGDPETEEPWGCFHPFSSVALDAKERFADAVIQRLGS